MGDDKSAKTPAQTDRASRQAAALRENLKRRKQQARGRAAQSDALARAAALRAFWFGMEGSPEFGRMREAWFKKDGAFDDLCRSFHDDYARAARGEYDALMETAVGAVVLVVLLDQMPRNMFRGTAQAFATDARARAVAARAIEAGFDTRVPAVERMFLYLPFEHSESLADQRRSVALFESLPVTPEFSAADRDNTVDYARRHLAAIERFGRFPHRNAALGRVSTTEELAFLQGPNSSF
jgi:uncharacterized protein (DUF924 family)